MKKLSLFVSIVIVISIMSLYAKLNSVPQSHAYDGSQKEVVCRSEACAQVEAAVLRSTVRIHLQAWRMKADESGFELEESLGHATLRNGRTLVSHNHFEILEQVDVPDTAISVVIYDSSGRYLFSSPLTDFAMSLEGDETRVFEMKYEYDQLQMAGAGIVSAQFDDWHSLDLKPGMAVAQIDWDGTATRVDWTVIEEVITGDGLPRVILSEGVTRGGSGGGVFLNGIHIANNWQSIERLDGEGNVVYATSVAPLNG